MKRRIIVGLLVTAAVLVSVVVWSSPSIAADLSDFVTIFKGFEISPVRLDLRGKNLALVGLGSYIVNAQGGCNDCHTNPPYEEGGNPFEGEREQINRERYLAGGAPFGPFISRNLTPNERGLPAGLTLPQFFQVMRHGVDFKNEPPTDFPSPLLQVMPWPVYRNMSDMELRAIYEFLRSIPRVTNGD